MPSITNVLDHEWRRLASSPEARGRLRQWDRRYPALAGYSDLQALLDGRDGASAAVKQAILLALARLAPTDQLAARTLLQALVPGLVMLAAAYPDDPTVREDIVAIAWERIRTYPSTRFGLVALNVLRDTRKRYWEHRQVEVPSTVELYSGAEPVCLSAEQEAMSSVMIKELAAALDRGLVSRRGLGLVLRTRIAGTPLQAIADEEGVKVHTLIALRARAERHLRRLPLAG